MCMEEREMQELSGGLEPMAPVRGALVENRERAPGRGRENGSFSLLPGSAPFTGRGEHLEGRRGYLVRACAS